MPRGIGYAGKTMTETIKRTPKRPKSKYTRPLPSKNKLANARQAPPFVIAPQFVRVSK